MADLTASRSSGFTYFDESVSRTNSSPSFIVSSSVDAQYLPSRNSITKAGTPKALRIRRSRSLRTTKPGNTSFESPSSSSIFTGWSAIPLHIPSHGQLDAASRKLLASVGVPHVQHEGVSSPERLRRVEEQIRSHV